MTDHANHDPVTAEPGRDAPESPRPGPLAIFGAFARIGLSSIGGGGTAHIHEHIVSRRRWLAEADFLEAMTIARTLPGTNVSNLASFIGAGLGGRLGALMAALGVVLPGVAFVLVAAAAYTHFAAMHSKVFEGMFHGFTAGAIGVMAALVWQTSRTSLKGYGAMAIAVASFAAVAILYVNMAFVLVALVPLSAWVNEPRNK